ncbi:MAG: aminotransferase class I/II-fold pyridoxal phosphate-dependent enzyme [Chthoniobacterales bacterium]
MNSSTISRRRFAQLLGAGAALSLARPALSFAREPAVATSGIVRLNSNENPFGPSAKALAAIPAAYEYACRYPDAHAEMLIEALAKTNGVSSEQILLGAGSGEILRISANAFDGPLVMADPTFEALAGHAKRRGAAIVKVPLIDTFAHDLPKMAAAAKGGLVYLCNPNNPTASITPKNDVREFIAQTPPETMILVDEAYHHYVESDDYESVIPLMKDHPNLIVARTFSKIYGMAGMRCGYAIAQPATIERMQPHQLNDGVNILALVAASASIADAAHVPDGRKLNSETRKFVTDALAADGFESIPSQANFVMVNLKRPVVPVIEAMKKQKVKIGRLFPALPNHMRLTIGRKAEMEAFLTAFRAAMV